MLVREYYGKAFNGKDLYKTYSDQQLMIRQVETGILYEEAVDLEDAPYTYEETDQPILEPEPAPDPEPEEDQEETGDPK